MMNSNKSVLLKNLPVGVTEEQLCNILASKYNNPKLLRFKTRSGMVLKTVKVDFASIADQEQCLKDGVRLDSLSVNVEKYIPRKRVIQCYKCWRFGHIAVLCPNNLTCVNCTDNHRSCITKSYRQLRCSNCNGNHPANDRLCPVYKEVEFKVFSSADIDKQNIYIQDY